MYSGGWELQERLQEVEEDHNPSHLPQQEDDSSGITSQYILLPNTLAEVIQRSYRGHTEVIQRSY